MTEEYSREDLEAFRQNHGEIVDYLHEHMDELPPKIKDELWDMFYAHFEP